MNPLHGLSSAGVIPITVQTDGSLNIYSAVAEKAVASGTLVMTNGDTVFTIANGPIIILDILSECITANGVGATTMQWNSVPTVGSAITISGASLSLASATAGTTVRLAPTALNTALVIVTAANGGVQIGTNVSNSITVMAGALKLVIGTGPTTGTWKHYMRYRPLSTNVTVTGT